MELRVFYQKIRNLEAGISEPYVVVVSLETPDGGVAGVPIEVARATAARLVVEQRARLATDAESEDYKRAAEQARHAAEQAAAASRLQLAIVSEPEMRAFRPAGKAKN